MKTRFLVLLISILLLSAAAVNAQAVKPLKQLFLMADDDEGTFLGSFENEYASKSIFNKFGNYGSQFSSTSIFNQFSQYGSEFSKYSAFNKLATNPPIIVDDEGNIYGVLSINSRAKGVTDDSYQLAKRLKIRWNALNK